MLTSFVELKNNFACNEYPWRNISWKSFSVVFLRPNFSLPAFIKDETNLWCLKDELTSFVELKNDCACNGNPCKNSKWKISGMAFLRPNYSFSGLPQVWNKLWVLIRYAVPPFRTIWSENPYRCEYLTTADLPFPQPNIYPNFSSSDCHWVRGGVGGHLLRYWDWSVSPLPKPVAYVLIDTV